MFSNISVKQTQTETTVPDVEIKIPAAEIPELPETYRSEAWRRSECSPACFACNRSKFWPFRPSHLFQLFFSLQSLYQDTLKWRGIITLNRSFKNLRLGELRFDLVRFELWEVTRVTRSYKSYKKFHEFQEVPRSSKSYKKIQELQKLQDVTRVTRSYETLQELQQVTRLHEVTRSSESYKNYKKLQELQENTRVTRTVLRVAVFVRHEVPRCASPDVNIHSFTCLRLYAPVRSNSLEHSEKQQQSRLKRKQNKRPRPPQ